MPGRPRGAADGAPRRIRGSCQVGPVDSGPDPAERPSGPAGPPAGPRATTEEDALIDLTPLDWILVLALVLYAVGGWVRGFFLTLGSVVGFVAGSVAAFYVAPWLVQRVDGGWRVVVAVASLVGLILLGQALGLALGRPLRSLTERFGLGIVDRIAGLALNLLTCAAVIVILSFSASNIGIASVTSAINNSRVVSGLESLTPAPAKQAIAQARAAVVRQSGIPMINEQLFPAESAPTQQLDNSALTQAAASVVRVNGTAAACMQNQTGSGFVVSAGMVVTNAHVVAGVDEPVVETQDGTSYTGTVVHYDAATDLAVISVPDLPTAALSTGEDASAGDLVDFMGYPHGGPFSSKPATVQGLGYTSTTSRDGTKAQPREIYQLAADVQQGNSGGPLLNQQGQVIGVVFAKSTEGQTGYALSLTELKPVLEGLSSMTSQVSTGQCTTGD